MDAMDCLEQWAKAQGIESPELDDDGRFCLETQDCQVVIEPLRHAILIYVLQPWRNQTDETLRELLASAFQQAMQQALPVKACLSDQNELCLMAEISTDELDVQSLQSGLEVLLNFRQQLSFVSHG